jgi:hypothetical protein
MSIQAIGSVTELAGAAGLPALPALPAVASTDGGAGFGDRRPAGHPRVHDRQQRGVHRD